MGFLLSTRAHSGQGKKDWDFKRDSRAIRDDQTTGWGFRCMTRVIQGDEQQVGVPVERHVSFGSTDGL